MGREQNEESYIKKPRPPATTPEAREKQLIALAVSRAEQQLRDGTASAMVISHYLKMASPKELLERKLLEENVKLAKAKTDAIESQQRVEELYKEAMIAFRTYQGVEVDGDV